MPNELLAQHEAVKLWHQTGGVVNAFTVTVVDDDQDRFIAVDTDQAKAKAFANIAFKAHRHAEVDPVAAAAAAVYEHKAQAMAAAMAAEYGRDPATWIEEARNATVNGALGLCPDGCCGGPECMEDPEEVKAWKAWRTRLYAAQQTPTNA